MSTEAIDLKNLGNDLFSKKKYGAAIDKYTEAILMDNTVSTFYSNRALCYYKKEQYEKMAEDSSTAISLDKNNLKGHYLHGLSQIHLDSLEAGITSLALAYEASHAKNVSKSFKREIKVELLKAKKVRWENEFKRKKAEYEALQVALACIASNNSNSNDETLASITRVLNVEQQETEVPECFLCPISMEILMDPVTTPNGVSYERAMITTHLKRNGYVDPMTREVLTLDMLRPNVSLREAIDHYLDEHPWAYE